MAKSTSYWRHQNKELLHYDKAGTAGPTPFDRQTTVSDWERWRQAEATSGFFINGPLHRLETRPFTKDNLKIFFKTQFFSEKIEAEQEKFAEYAMQHFSQGGLQRATYLALNSAQTHNGYRLPEPEARVDFNTTARGLEIIETNTYRDIVDDRGKHYTVQDPTYHARTKTTTLMTADNILLLDLEVDCPSSKVAERFDKRTLLDKLLTYLRNMVADWRSQSSNPDEVVPLEGAKSIYRFE